MTLGPLEATVGLAVLIAGLVTLAAPRRLTAAVSFLVFGVLLTLAWAVLRAPDVALAEAVIGTGVTGALLIDAATRGPSGPSGPPGRSEPPAGAPRRRTPWSEPAIVLLLLPAIAALSWAFAAALGRHGELGLGLGALAAQRTPDTGVSHPITAVLLGFRAYDTLLEIAVFLVAAVVVLALGPVRGAQRPERHQRSALLELFIRVLGGLLILVTIWYLVAGSSRPGGAFQAGALLAGVLIVLHAAGVRPMDPHSRTVRVTVGVGLLAFLAFAAIGPALGAGVLALPTPYAGWLILALETVLTLTVGVSLAAMFVALSGRAAPRGSAR